MYNIYVLVWALELLLSSSVCVANRGHPAPTLKVVKVNVLLKEMEKIEGAHFWSHRGFWADLSYLGQDGVHIKEESRHMKKYMHSIRLAVLQHAR